MSEYDFKKIEISLDQIAAALERLNPPPSQYPSFENHDAFVWNTAPCLLYTSPSPRDVEESRMPSSA